MLTCERYCLCLSTFGCCPFVFTVSFISYRILELFCINVIVLQMSYINIWQVSDTMSAHCVWPRQGAFIAFRTIIVNDDIGRLGHHKSLNMWLTQTKPFCRRFWPYLCLVRVGFVLAVKVIHESQNRLQAPLPRLWDVFDRCGYLHRFTDKQSDPPVYLKMTTMLTFRNFARLNISSV